MVAVGVSVGTKVGVGISVGTKVAVSLGVNVGVADGVTVPDGLMTGETIGVVGFGGNVVPREIVGCAPDVSVAVGVCVTFATLVGVAVPPPKNPPRYSPPKMIAASKMPPTRLPKMMGMNSARRAGRGTVAGACAAIGGAVTVLVKGCVTAA